jgi:RNA binding exosome subunit
MMKNLMRYFMQHNGSRENTIWFINWNLRRTEVSNQFMKSLVEKLERRDARKYTHITITNGYNGLYVPQIREVA